MSGVPLFPLTLFGYVRIEDLLNRQAFAGQSAGFQTIRRPAFFNPRFEGTQGIEIVQADRLSPPSKLKCLRCRAVVHTRHHEETEKFLSFFYTARGSHHPIIVVQGIQRRHDGICPAMVHEDFAPRLLELAEIGTGSVVNFAHELEPIR